MKKLLSIFMICVMLFLPACTQSDEASPKAETISGQDSGKPLIEDTENSMMLAPDDLKEASSSQNTDSELQQAEEEDEPETFQSGDFTYILLDDDTAEITDYSDGGPNGRTKTLSIPNELDGHPVTSIGAEVFYLSSQLTDITIPDSVTSIGNSAFSRCYSLQEITIPDSVTEIGTNPFAECDHLTSIYVSPDHPYLYVTDNALFSKKNNSLICYPAGMSATGYEIPQGTGSIGDYAFSHCDYLTSITIPDSVTSIGSSAFYDCYHLESITIPDSVTSIGDHAFYECDGLTNLTIPDSITSIENGTFSYCRGLHSITIPDSVTSIGDYAFDTCYSLTSVTIPDSVTSIGKGAFLGCERLTIFTIPDGVTSIENDTFAGCSNLAHITIPNSVTSIGDYAFATCDRLYSITIPDSVTSISSLAFNAVDNITITVSRGSYAEQYCRLNGFQYYLSQGNSNQNLLSMDGAYEIVSDYSSYLELVRSKQSTLDVPHANWDPSAPRTSRQTVEVLDVWGDDTPELILAESRDIDNYNNSLEPLAIYTYQDGQIIKLYEKILNCDYQNGMAMNYFLVQISGDKALYFYESQAHEAGYSTWYRLSDEGKMTEQVIVREEWMPNFDMEPGDYENTSINTYYDDAGNELSKEAYEAWEEDFVNSIERVILSPNVLWYGDPVAMTYDEAIAFLEGSANIENRNNDEAQIAMNEQSSNVKAGHYTSDERVGQPLDELDITIAPDGNIRFNVSWVRTTGIDNAVAVWADGKASFSYDEGNGYHATTGFLEFQENSVTIVLLETTLPLILADDGTFTQTFTYDEAYE